MGEKDEALFERNFSFIFRAMRIHGDFRGNDDQTFILECHSETERCCRHRVAAWKEGYESKGCFNSVDNI